MLCLGQRAAENDKEKQIEDIQPCWLSVSKCLPIIIIYEEASKKNQLVKTSHIKPHRSSERKRISEIT